MALLRSFGFLLALAPLAALGCSNDSKTTPVIPGVPRDWERLATPTSVAFKPVRDLVPVRGIIHSHSPYSHDACDGHGLDANGKPDATCTAHLRLAVCEAAEDFIFLTDHGAHMAEHDFPDLLYIGPQDEPIKGADGAPIGNWLHCDDGRKVLLTAGNENELMSLGLEHHLPGDVQARLAAYGGTDQATVDAMHAAGGLVMQAHTEQRTIEYLSTVQLDGQEIYNLHAAIDPDIRKDFLGLDAYAAAASILPFTSQDEGGPQPDLTILGFFEDLPIYGQRLDEVAALRHVTGVAGTDVHENTFATLMRDGERGDSYRRLMRWFSNVVLVKPPLTLPGLKDALKAGRSYVAFEILGIPEGFDFRAESGGTVVEMGGEAPAGANLRAQAPRVYNLDPVVQAPTISMRLLHAVDGKTETVAEGASISLDGAKPGVYRVEVRIMPRHLRPYLGYQGDLYVREVPWVLSNPIWVK
jgi:hypothetical protein